MQATPNLLESVLGYDASAGNPFARSNHISALHAHTLSSDSTTQTNILSILSFVINSGAYSLKKLALRNRRISPNMTTLLRGLPHLTHLLIERIRDNYHNATAEN
ncbi:hypothetical protein C8R47DRAFT_1216923 [Mycena vitilis]|nr:hypothetical protein C8R47DRAFT_1216923 [Mycena vitilis]